MEHLFRGVGRLSTVVMEKASGSFVWTATGERLLDFTSGMSWGGHSQRVAVFEYFA